MNAPIGLVSVTLLATVATADEERASLPYRIVDTGQSVCYSDTAPIRPPQPGQAFYGQDAQHVGNAPDYLDHGDGTVTDRVTGLMWQQGAGEELTFPEAVAGARRSRLGGHADWRLPGIKELYSLIMFYGDLRRGQPFLDTHVFAFRYGDVQRGQRIIDAQTWSSTEYVGTTFNGVPTVFGVNFADGRIKGYPRDRGPRGVARHYVRYVRGNPQYGRNDFLAHGDGTVTDRATGLMWQQGDSGRPLDWRAALAYAAQLTLAGHDDWRAPNAKELHSIVDYTRAPDATDPARRGPAIDPVFTVTEAESWYWTSTTFPEGPGMEAVYLCFGQGFGVIGGRLINVHGAGCQRSDPKSGDPARWSRGRGPQNDQVRILNYVRCVRGGG